MEPTGNDGRSGHVNARSIRLDDGTSVSLDAVIAEGRRQRAREIRRLASAAARWIARTVRTFASLVPAHESRRKIPSAGPMAERFVAGAEAATFRTNAVHGHAAEKMRKGDHQPLAA